MAINLISVVFFQNFVSDFSAIITEGACEGEQNQHLLNEVICEHFLRQGMLDIAEALNEVSRTQIRTDGNCLIRIKINVCCFLVSKVKQGFCF